MQSEVAYSQSGESFSSTWVHYKEKGRIVMKKIKGIKGIAATILSLGLMMAGSLTSFAAELPEQRSEETVAIESIAAETAINPDYEGATLYVKGDGVRLRRTAGTSGEIVGLLYEAERAWVTLSGVYEDKDGHTWLRVTNSSIGLKGWIAEEYVKSYGPYLD